MKPILPGSTIGMLGGGQLGRMSTVSAKQMGYRVIVLEPNANSPCGQVADVQLQSVYTDSFNLGELAEACDVITYEFENIPTEAVDFLVSKGGAVYPSAQVLFITQSRLREKDFARQAGLNVVDFQAIESRADLDNAAATIGFPAILKTVSGGYDGKGQFVLTNHSEAVTSFERMPGATLIWEKQAAFVKELSVICARNHKGEVASYPATENIHRHNILDMSIAPARVSEQVQQKAQQIAHTIATELDLVGVCGVELFLLPDETLLVNEIAPRPHNSGHYTIDACPCSQFEQHIRAVCGLPLGSTALHSQAAVMVNILGTGTGHKLVGVDQILADPRLHFHLYGKAEAKAKRKMGHLTVLASEAQTAIDLALAAREKLTWVPHNPAPQQKGRL